MSGYIAYRDARCRGIVASDFLARFNACTNPGLPTNNGKNVMPMSLIFIKSIFTKNAFLFSRRLLLLSVAALTLSACSWFAGDDPAAEDALLLSPLEIPPDLVSPKGDPRLARPTLPALKKTSDGKLATTSLESCQCSEPPRIGEQVLPQGKGVQRMREGQRRWLIAQAEPEQVWPLVSGFLEMRGYRVQRDEPAIGLFETDWKPVLANASVDKKRATDKNGQANWRERLRIRIEPADKAGYTEIYLTQHHSQRVSEAAEVTAKWELRPSDTDRAVEMLNRLAHHLAAKNVQDAVPLKPLTVEIKIDADGHTVLQLDSRFDIAWRRTSLALDDLGFTIEDHDRASRIFHVYNDLPSGLTEEELKHGKQQSATVREEYWLHLQERGEHINVSVRNKAGQVDESQLAHHLLNLLSGQFQ